MRIWLLCVYFTSCLAHLDPKEMLYIYIYKSAWFGLGREGIVPTISFMTFSHFFMPLASFQRVLKERV